ncbi:MAG: hypothetical protein EOP86_12420 [Verrucomicrobiaceae bacterium]|nr:MAG: hypothetical protein EOP86_12420 [Verrucomicrobiaceae bacterium]
MRDLPGAIGNGFNGNRHSGEHEIAAYGLTRSVDITGGVVDNEASGILLSLLLDGDGLLDSGHCSHKDVRPGFLSFGFFLSKLLSNGLTLLHTLSRSSAIHHAAGDHHFAGVELFARAGIMDCQRKVLPNHLHGNHFAGLIHIRSVLVDFKLKRGRAALHHHGEKFRLYTEDSAIGGGATLFLLLLGLLSGGFAFFVLIRLGSGIDHLKRSQGQKQTGGGGLNSGEMGKVGFHDYRDGVVIVGNPPPAIVEDWRKLSSIPSLQMAFQLR